MNILKVKPSSLAGVFKSWYKALKNAGFRVYSLEELLESNTKFKYNRQSEEKVFQCLAQFVVDSTDLTMQIPFDDKFAFSLYISKLNDNTYMVIPQTKLCGTKVREAFETATQETAVVAV